MQPPDEHDTSESSSDDALAATERSPNNELTTRGGVRPIGTTVGRYRLNEVLGSGGMGTVYRARDFQLERDVAVKLLPPAADVERALDEARTMAKLNHPSIVSVFDVGLIDGSVYFVMPLFNSGTLKDWARAQARPWADVVRRFVRAGRGLTAAHAAGIVHRDFKPSNVVLDGDEVLVADFGIAVDRGTDQSGRTTNEPASVVGTLAYMAPEQSRGEAVDALADQYSFCVSFWECLHGERPSEAETRTIFVSRGGRPKAPQSSRAVPGWLRKALARGFALSPSDRWPSLEALLDHIESRQRRPRRVMLAAATLAVAVGSVVAATQIGNGAEERCGDTNAKLGRVWGPPARMSIESAFAATGLAYAPKLASIVVPELERRAREWHATRISTCRIARSRLPDIARDLRMQCLDRWLLDLDATVRILSAAKDAGTVDDAVNSARALNPASDCNDDGRLAKASPPADKRVEAQAIDTELRELEVKHRSGLAVDSVAEVEELVHRARQLNHSPTLGRAIRAKARLLVGTSNNLERRAVLEELAKVSAATSDDITTASAWLELVMVLKELKRPQDARTVLAGAQAAVIRAGSPTDLHVRLLQAEAWVRDGVGDGKRALELLDEARRILLEHGADREGSEYAELLQGVTIAFGSAQGNAGDYAASIESFKSALRTGEKLVGSDHPKMARLHDNLAESLRRAERYEEALAAFRSAERIARISVGESPAMVRYRGKIGAILHVLGRNEESMREYADVLVLAERILKPDDLALLALKNDYTNVLRAEEKHDHALHLIDEVIPQYESHSEPSTSLLLSRHNRAGILRSLRRFDEALAEHDRAVKLLAVAPNAHRHAVIIQVGVGLTLLDAGRPGDAIKPLELATKDTGTGRSETSQRRAQWLLGRARVEARQDVARGLDEVKAARAALLAAGQTDDITEIDAWLAKR